MEFQKKSTGCGMKFCRDLVTIGGVYLSLLFLFCLTSYCQVYTLEDFLPAHSADDQIVKHFVYTLKYNEKHEQAEWVIYLLTKERVTGSVSRTNDFRPDPSVKTGSASLADYKSSGYDRGHLAPAGDMKWSARAMSESFYMSNMSPQKPRFNRGIWKNLESLVRTWATNYEEIYIVTGPVLSEYLSTIGPNKVAVPKYYYKVILDYKQPELKGIGFILPNQSSRSSLQNYAVTIDSVESLTGIDFFPVLPDLLENVLESSLDLDKWSFIYLKRHIQGKATSKELPVEKRVLKTPTKASDTKQITVYITKTGKKYHRSGCRYLRKSKISISLKNAKVRGYTPCSRCNPP